MKNYSTILTENQQKCQHYLQVKLINMNILQEINIYDRKKILPSDQNRLIEQAKFTFSPLSKAFKNRIRTIENQVIKQVESLKTLKQKGNQKLESIQGLFSNNMKTNKIKNEIDKVKKWRKKLNEKT